jgi:hypothetical protein
VASITEHMIALAVPELVIIRLLLVAAEISVLVIGPEILQTQTQSQLTGFLA